MLTMGHVIDRSIDGWRCDPCLPQHNKDVEALARIVPIGTPVKIRRE
jgi:hypothetical protein